MSKNKKITLTCGIEAETWIESKKEWLSISMIDLYNAYGILNNPAKLAELFSELSAKEYSLDGLSRVEGYYGSTDDLLLRAYKQIQK